MSDKVNIDNVRYSLETQEYFQRQIEEAVNTLVNKDNTENNKAFDFFMDSEASGINEINEDTSPTLGGNLNLNGKSLESGMIPSLSGTGKSLVLGF
jgi:hypothetical protein|tara:strand:- start:2061 stop:2348 length:288 start_codon:yes stop_codon:yes gene_type:complete